MTIRLEMLRAAGRSRKLLNDSGESVIRFVRSRFQDDGGFRGRGPQSDLYYTVFAMGSLLALEAELPTDRIEAYLLSFDQGDSLDLVHLACLCQCWADLSGRKPSSKVRRAVLDRIESCRSRSGGYGIRPGVGIDSVYNGFLALGAYQDLDESLPDAPALARRVEPEASDPTPLLAGAAVLLAELGVENPEPIKDWLLARHDEHGGFLAAPSVPVPDLLSTATALHALARLGVSLDAIREPCLEFVESLRKADHGFCGVCLDNEADCEYTFYGLLALGHLVP